MKILKIALTAATAALLLTGSSYAGKQDNENVRRYSDGVSLLNLLNGLNLTAEQQQRILDMNKELRDLRDGALNGQKAQELEAEKEKAMGELYNYLLSNPEKEDKDIQSRAAKADHNLREYRDDSMKKLSPEFDRISKEVEGILSSEQLDVINNFAPCVVPPKDMRDPVRAGQAKSSDATVKALEQARQLNAAKKDVDSFAQKTADHTIEASEHKAKLSPEEQKEVRERVVATIKQAIKLSDTDFEIQKPLLAQKLEPVNKIEDLKTEINQRNPHANPLQNSKGSKVVQFLVNPDTVIPIFERRLQAAAPGGLKGAAKDSPKPAQEKTATTTTPGSWK